MDRTIIVLCHGFWGQSLVNDFQEFFGSSCEIKVFPLGKDTSKEKYEKDVLSYAKNKPQSILVCDLFGSTTFQVALKIALDSKIPAFMNLSLGLLMSIADILEEEKSFEESIDTLELNESLCRNNIVRLYHEFKNGGDTNGRIDTNKN
ncbi:hypothetical protein ACWOAH_00550 [Vagococcus vulneris]|uniref:PTS EIIA type-4 domain-containing protein n=1 Tax=Vagococcus vulneris TaxID=1977869 RepID=A0A430A2E6_9ENTE|nr:MULTISPECIES: hypothetical protein [Enterococcaceae]EKY7882991.1 hypothetical protein [Enterococcus faecium]EKZ0497278.1 hypothetical protein [Enterococcus faecium]PQW11192.1 hypothetical protein CWC52_06505 [Enterococcus faecium]QQG03596.1 hypothetical protein JCP95_07790 [Enterococcus faecium]RSU00618.1 hypothetical protein CBF37_00990 [Vagococcus vulneris]